MLLFIGEGIISIYSDNDAIDDGKASPLPISTKSLINRLSGSEGSRFPEGWL